MYYDTDNEEHKPICHKVTIYNSNRDIITTLEAWGGNRHDLEEYAIGYVQLNDVAHSIGAVYESN